MNKKLAGLLFLAVCIILAILLITKTISSTTSGLIFAVSLVIFGLLSKVFRKQS